MGFPLQISIMGKLIEVTRDVCIGLQCVGVPDILSDVSCEWACFSFWK